jgi:hypothetical protein
MRRAAKIDGNHTEIVKQFRGYPGVTVLSLAAIGKGVPDLLVAFRGVMWLVEIKMGKGKQNAEQIKFANDWAGCCAVVRNSADVDWVIKEMQVVDS